MAGIAASRSQEGARERPAIAAAALESVNAKLLHGLADFGGGGCRGQRLPEGDAHRIRDGARAFPEEAAAGKTENGAPDAVEIDGDDGNVDAFHDALKAAAEGQHLANAGDLAFRKNAYNFAVAQRLRGIAQGVDHFAWALIRGDGDDFQHARKGLDERMIVNALEHQKADGGSVAEINSTASTQDAWLGVS